MGAVSGSVVGVALGSTEGVGVGIGVGVVDAAAGVETPAITTPMTRAAPSADRTQPEREEETRDLCTM
ncbi:hypothetical protein GCM10009775_18690 [Microbacterium aoyamense]|uniref:Uncharacterized protein n=1 Tax=Microbacterium aoyamense TaxID=344166 RepID=A0ABP5AZD2_9MICO